MSDSCLLIGDIGGTNARFALARRDAPGFDNVLQLKCADFDSARAAIDHYLQAQNAGRPDVICFAAAGPVIEQIVRFTNNHWSLAAADLVDGFPAAKVKLLNDFESVAYSIPHLDATDCLQVGLPQAGSLPANDYTVGVVGPGTGLGAVGLKVIAGVSVPIAGEAGHIGFAPTTQVQLEILSVLREHYGRVSAERLVCGSGIENIHWALGRVHGQDWPQRSAEEIFAAAQSNKDGKAAEAVQMFFAILGQFAGDYALALGAYDGILIAGGIVPRYPGLLVNSGFRAGFENKGRYKTTMENIPTRLITHKFPGLLGAAAVAASMATE